jgi:hypothetical protein
MRLDFCAACGTTEDLHQHHIDPIILSGAERVVGDYTDQITLCTYHHNMIHGRSGQYNHKELVKIGLRKAKERGIKLGRKSKTNASQKKEIQEKVQSGLSISKVALEYGISRASVMNISGPSQISSKKVLRKQTELF